MLGSYLNSVREMNAYINAYLVRCLHRDILITNHQSRKNILTDMVGTAVTIRLSWKTRKWRIYIAWRRSFRQWNKNKNKKQSLKYEKTLNRSGIKYLISITAQYDVSYILCYNWATNIKNGKYQENFAEQNYVVL